MKGQSEHIRTFARIKPIAFNQEKIFVKRNICAIGSKTNLQQFLFDSIFDSKVSNQQVYETTTKPILQHSFKGYNSCILAYGQTASGKTYTMKGTTQEPGIIPLCIYDIFQKLESRRLTGQVKVSYFEIYNENIIDLLNQRENTYLQLRQDQKKNLKMPGLVEKQIFSMLEAMNCFDKGQQKRKFASNCINNMSSRSHVIFRIHLHVIHDNWNQTYSQINLVDLAGSQGIHRTKSQGTVKIQGQNINKSILALSKVIKAMSQKQNYVNFRDSKLTRILQQSLCSNSKSTIICTINPSKQNYQQSVNTLKFGSTAGKIKISTYQNLIESQQQKNRNIRQHHTQIKSAFQLMPSQKIQLQDRRLKMIELHQEIKQLKNTNRILEENLYNKENSFNELEDFVIGLKQELRKKTISEETKRDQLWDQKNMYDSRLESYEEEIKNLQKVYLETKAQNKQLEKNQKRLAERLQHYQNQVKQLQGTISNMKVKMNEQINKSQKDSPKQKSKKSQPSVKQQNTNIFIQPPYVERQDNISPIKLTSLVELKIQIIDLGRKLNEFIKANIEIAQQNEQLREKLDKYQKPNSHIKCGGKLNPSVLQANEIRKLQNKIKRYKQEIQNLKNKQKNYRQTIKRQSVSNLQQIQEFQQWYNRKNDRNFWVEKQIQTEDDKNNVILQQNNYSFQDQLMNPVKLLPKVQQSQSPLNHRKDLNPEQKSSAQFSFNPSNYQQCQKSFNKQVFPKTFRSDPYVPNFKAKFNLNNTEQKKVSNDLNNINANKNPNNTLANTPYYLLASQYSNKKTPDSMEVHISNNNTNKNEQFQSNSNHKDFLKHHSYQNNRHRSKSKQKENNITHSNNIRKVEKLTTAMLTSQKVINETIQEEKQKDIEI